MLDEPRSMTSIDGAIHFHFDPEAYDFHLDVAPTYNPADLNGVLAQLDAWGLELLDEDECEPKMLEGGVMRMYLTSILPERGETPDFESAGFESLLEDGIFWVGIEDGLHPENLIPHQEVRIVGVPSLDVDDEVEA